MKKIPIILDTDIGSDIDDTWALAQLLRSPELDCKMVATVGGNTLYRAKIVAKFLGLADRDDIPVVLGDCNLNAGGKFQEPWVADYSRDDYKGVIVDNGIDEMCRLLTESERITVVSIGRTTNIAAVIDRIGDEISKHKFVGMHGSVYKGYGDSDTPSPEANVYTDVESFRKVIQAPWKDILLTPLDTCGNVHIEFESYQKLLQSDDTFVKAILENYAIWEPSWMEVTDEIRSTRSSTLFDCVAVYLAYDESLVKTKTINMSVTDEGLTYEDADGAPVRIAYEWIDYDAFLDDLIARLMDC